MKKLKTFSKRLMKNDRGQGMVEYILLLVVVVGIVMALKSQFSGKATEWFENMAGQVQNVLNQ